MKTYTIHVVRTLKVSDSIKVNANCPQEAKRIARAIAIKQTNSESIGDKPDKITFEGKEYSKFIWGLEDGSPSYSTEIIS